MPIQLELTLFGSPEIRLHSRPLGGFRSSKVQALLFYLAVTGRPHTRTVLATLFWGDQPETAARINLRTSLSNLHDLVGAGLLIERQTVAFNRTYPYSLDTERLDAALALPPSAETTQALQAALALYRGDFLEGFYVRDAPDFEQWLLLQRAYYRETAVNGLQALAQRLEQQGDLHEAIRYTRRLLALEPWQEAAHGRLMIWLARTGQRGAALAQYESCRQLLMNELAVEPDAATVATVEAIRLGAFEQQATIHGDKAQPAAAPASTQPPSANHRVDWGEAPDVSRFYGRQAEVETLHRWLVQDQCRLVVVLGIGGIGKSALATLAASQVEEHFSALIWRSLRNAPPPLEFIGQCIQGVALEGALELPATIDERLALLMEELRRRRCLLIFDNVETVLQGERAGHYLPGYEGYGHLLQQVAQSRHQSCLLLTSREKPKELVPLAGEAGPVRTLALTSLSPADGRLLLQDRGLRGADQEWLALHERYSGNPLALQIVSEPIRELFGGDIAHFLRQETILVGGIVELLAHQFARLSSLEQEILLWLAVEREAVGLEEVRADITPSPAPLAVLEALRSLRQRSLVERVEGGFTVQNVVLEFLTAHLIEQMVTEIVAGQTRFLNRYALLKAEAKSYVRESQRKLIVAPIAAQVVEHFGRAGAVEQLQCCLASLRAMGVRPPGYAAGNLLNLLVTLNGQVRGQDFSRLAVWQADLRGIEAQELDLSDADLAKSVFSETFGSVYSVAFSPDGERVAAGGDRNDVRLWQVSDGQPLLTCNGHSSFVVDLAFTPDSMLLASASHDNTVRVWEMQNGRCIAILQEHTSKVRSVTFTPDGCFLASGGDDRTICVWERATWQCIAVLQGHTQGVNSVRFSPAGGLLASGGADGMVCLWEVGSWQLLARLEGHTRPIPSVGFNPTGTLLASTAPDRTLRLWDVASRQCQVISLDVTVDYLCISPDGELIAGGCNNYTVRLWDARSGHLLGSLQGHFNCVISACFSPNGALLATGSEDQSVRLWKMPSRQCVAILQGYNSAVENLRFSAPDSAGRYFMASSEKSGIICLWDGESGRLLKQWQGHSNEISRLCFRPATAEGGPLLATAGYDGCLRVWEVPSGDSVALLTGNWLFVRGVAFSPDGRILAGAAASKGLDRNIYVWEGSNWQALATLRGHHLSVEALCFSPDGRLLASGSDDRTIRIWERSSWQCLMILRDHRHAIISLSFSPDGRTLASASFDHTVRLWDVASGECRATWQVAPLEAICYSPDGHLLACASGNRVSLLDAHSGEQRMTLNGHQAGVLSVQFRPDGRVLASGSLDETIRLWDVASGECIDILRSVRPYERMKIGGATGLTEGQRTALIALGAVTEG